MEPILEKYFNLMEQNKLLFWQMLDGISDEQFHWKKNATTWSLAQVLDHVIFSEASALSYCQKKLKAGDQMPDATFFNTLKIRLYFWALHSRLRFKAPKLISNPANDRSIADTMTYWDQTRDEYERFLEDYPSQYLGKAVFRHPLAGRIKLAEMLHFLNTHLIHHRYQVDRIKREM
ncbi:DinB family protein [Marinoscillum sp.]|uniref:DinB family protein n=1 Tax=Marinoscillum sp. TaxID=2024838 RepID=UPI003BAD3D29